MKLVFLTDVKLLPMLVSAAGGQLDYQDYRTWIVKSVCVDSANGEMLTFDPYYMCPEGAIMKKAQVCKHFNAVHVHLYCK